MHLELTCHVLLCNDGVYADFPVDLCGVRVKHCRIVGGHMHQFPIGQQRLQLKDKSALHCRRVYGVSNDSLLSC